MKNAVWQVQCEKMHFEPKVHFSVKVHLTVSKSAFETKSAHCSEIVCTLHKNSNDTDRLEGLH